MGGDADFGRAIAKSGCALRVQGPRSPSWRGAPEHFMYNPLTS